MADTKITALAAITTVDPAADVLPIVDVSDTSMAASGTTKKITSNQILGAGGTATLASATITGDLTVDTSTLKVDSANNLVGIGTTAMSSYPVAPNLVVATSSNGGITIRAGSSNYAGLFFADGTTGDETYRGFVQYNHNYAGSVDSLVFGTAGSTKATLDSSGNLGLGTAPSAGGSNYYKTFELGKAGCGLFVATNNLTASELTYLSGNGVLKYNSGPEWSYGNAGSAAIYGIEDGVHKWFNAGSGSAGAVFVPTQAMTLDASGNLGIGSTSPGGKLSVEGSSVNGVLGYIQNNSASGSAGTDQRLTLMMGGTTGYGITDWQNSGIVEGTSTGGLYLGAYNGSVRFYAGASARTERVRVKSTGQVRFVPLAADPAGAEAGDVYYNSTSNKLKCYNGTSWNDLF